MGNTKRRDKNVRHRNILKKKIVISSLTLLVLTHLGLAENAMTIKDIVTPEGYDRIEYADGLYPSYLRNLPLKENNEILTWDGDVLKSSWVLYDVLAVVNLPLLYHEDLDLCLRARFLDYDIKLVTEARLYHKYTEGIPKHRWYWSERNRLLTLLKFYKIPTLIVIFPAWLFMELGILAYSLAAGWFLLKIKSYFSILLQIPKTLIKRRKIQKTRKITDKDLVKYLEPKFEFAGFTHPLLKYVVNPVLGLYWQIIKKIIIW